LGRKQTIGPHKLNPYPIVAQENSKSADKNKMEKEFLPQFDSSKYIYIERE
jgi:hypothetical protein